MVEEARRSGKQREVREDQDSADPSCLRSLGWEVTTGIKSSSTTKILLNTVPTVPTVPVHENDVKAKDDTEDDRDDILPTYSGPASIDIKTVLSVPALDPVTRGNCPICEKRDVSLVWQVIMMDGQHKASWTETTKETQP